MRYFGCHVSAGGGLENALLHGSRLGVNTIQLHPSPPQRWNSKPFAAGVEKKFLEAREASGVKRVFFHGIYLINLANPDPQQFHLSKSSLLHDLDLASRLGGDGVIFHVGNSKHVNDERIGFERAAEGINWIMENAMNDARLILEVAAGAGAVIGDRVEELATIYDMVEQKQRVGFGLDTQHLWASGYDLQKDLDQVVKNIVDVFGQEKIWAIHINDSKTECASRKDRHENVGQGLIGREAMARFINHPKLKSIPMILETPALKDEDSAREEVQAFRSLVEE